jgi:hypothetical protein
MLRSPASRLLLGLVIVSVLIVGGVAVAAATGVKALSPVRMALAYPFDFLVEEVDVLNECVECHEPDDLHTCHTCHDDHGAIEMENVPFYAVIALTGDVPEAGFVLINKVLPYQDQPHTYVPLLDFLTGQGVTDFESVTLASADEGFVTIERPNLTSGSLLMPYEDGIRFADENLHVSTWIKGITRIIVVGTEKPLRIDGQATSMGRLLLGPTRSVTVEQTDVMLKSEADGQIRKGKTAARIEGVPIEALVADPAYKTLLVRDGSGQEYSLTAEEAQGAILYLAGDEVTLVLAGRGRSQWITQVVEVVSR